MYLITGLPLLIVVLSIVIASIQDGGVHSYIHGNLWVNIASCSLDAPFQKG